MHIDLWQPLSVPQTADHLYFLREGGKYFIQFAWLKFRVQAGYVMGKGGRGMKATRHQSAMNCIFAAVAFLPLRAPPPPPLLLLLLHFFAINLSSF